MLRIAAHVKRFLSIFFSESAQVQTLLLNDFCSGLCTQNIIGSSSVRVHLHKILKVRVRFRFNDLKFKRFRFGSGSPKKKRFLPVRGSGSSSVRLPGSSVKNSSHTELQS